MLERDKKIKILQYGNNEEIVRYYEDVITENIRDYTSSIELLKYPISKTNKEDKLNSLKSVVNNLLKENKRIVKELEKNKKAERVSQISREVINKLVIKIESNEK